MAARGPLLDAVAPKKIKNAVYVHKLKKLPIQSIKYQNMCTRNRRFIKALPALFSRAVIPLLAVVRITAAWYNLCNKGRSLPAYSL